MALHASRLPDGLPGLSRLGTRGHLLERHDADTTVTCLVQSKFWAEAESRAAEVESDHGTEERIELVEGDITESDLGLGDDYDDVADATAALYHLAAIYDLTMDRAPGKAVNIEGSRNVAEFVVAADADRYHYVSSVVVAGDYEGRFEESMLQEGQTFFNYYESTKHMAEVVVRERMDEVPTTIYRPGVAVGNSETGETQKYDGPYAFIEGLVDQGSTAVIPVSRGASKAEFNAVPSDYIVDAIGYRSGIEASEGKTYHLADPDPPSTTEMVKLLGEAAGKDRTLVVPYPKRLVEGVRGSLTPLLGESDLIKSGGLEYQTWPASFDCSNAVEDLEGSGVECPHFSEYAENLVAFYEANPDIGTEGMD